MTEKGILLMVRIGDVPPRIETEWNKWYDTEHIPNRLNISGFLSARRFVAIQGEYKYLTLYDLARIDVLTSEAYLKLRDWEASLPPESFEAITPKLPNCCRGLYEQVFPDQTKYQIPHTKILLAIGHDVPAEKDAEFNAWYNTEHLPALNRVPGFITARRFMAVETQWPSRAGRTSMSPKYLALCDLESEKILEDDAFLKEVNSPWSSWVRSWYHRRFRIVARRIYPEQ
jgi:hypothetical protein